GDKLSQVDQLINWNPFPKIVEGIFDNTSKKGIDGSKYSQWSTQIIKTIDRKLKIGVNRNSLL
ncbi:MAG: hypothetical protein ACXQTP_06980, partial [Candidatus Methanofastidiosia archaeon]